MLTLMNFHQKSHNPSVFLCFSHSDEEEKHSGGEKNHSGEEKKHSGEEVIVGSTNES